MLLQTVSQCTLIRIELRREFLNAPERERGRQGCDSSHQGLLMRHLLGFMQQHDRQAIVNGPKSFQSHPQSLLPKCLCLPFDPLGFSDLWGLYRHPSIGEPSPEVLLLGTLHCDLCTRMAPPGALPQAAHLGLNSQGH